MKSLKNLTKLSLAILLAISSTNIVNAASGVASIDVLKVYKQYSLVQEANLELDKMEEGFRKILATAEAEIAELEKKKPEEVENKKNEIQEVIDEQVVQVQEEKDLYNTTINRNFQNTLDEFAKERGYYLILDKGFLMYPADDITEEFLVRLEKAPKPKHETKK